VRTSTLALLTLFLTACLGSPYRTPPVSAPPQWWDIPNGVNEQPVVGGRWWSAFGDAVLDDLIHDALAGNLDLRAAAARVREARAARGITAARAKPQLDGAAVAFAGHPQDLYDVGFDASWELDLFGGIRRDVEAAIAQVEAAGEARRDVEITLVAEVARDYIELRGAQRRLDVLDARIETLRATRDIVRARQQAGLTNDLDVARSQALLEDTTAARPSLEYAAVAAIHRLAVLTGRQAGALRERLAVHAPIPVLSSDVPVGSPAQLIANRPDVRRAERELAAATARIDVVRADLYPRIALFGAFGHRSDSVSDLTDSSNRYRSFGPALRWPLLTGGRVLSQIEAQRARRDQADAAFEQTILRALEDVEDSLSSYGRDQQERARLGDAVAAERLAVDLADARYRAGLDSFLAVLDAQRTLRDGEDRLVAAEARVALSAIALFKSVASPATSSIPRASFPSSSGSASAPLQSHCCPATAR
jgi:NodT family efflux transporter outer membrane factor (OMF) lipoprotein